MRIRSRIPRLITALIVAAALIAGAPPLSASAVSDATVTGHVSLGNPEANHVAGDVVVTFDSSGAGTSVTTVYTDASGNYSVQLASGYYVIKYSYVGSAGYYADNWPGGQASLWWVQSGSRAINVTLPTVVPVSGSVFLGNSATSAGATGRISWYQWEATSWYYKTTFVHTAADGSFTVYLQPGSYKFVFATSTTGYQQWYGPAVQVGPAPLTGVNGVIPPKGQVSGHVTVGGQSATAGEVTVGIETCHVWFCDYPTVTPVVTDSSGNYSIPNLWDGGYKLTFTYKDSTYQTYKTYQLELDDTLRVRVIDRAMVPSRELGGTVYLGDTSVKAGAGEVSVKIKKDGNTVATVSTDANGHYGATGLQDGSYTLSFTYLGTALIRGLDYPITLSADNLAVNVTLPKQNTVSGTVVDADGIPMLGVYVALSGFPLGGGYGTYLSATTDVDGNYKFSNVPNGNYTAKFTRLGYAWQAWPYESYYEGDNIRLSSSGVVDIDAEMYAEGIIEVGVTAPALDAADYSLGYVGAYLHMYDFDTDDWRQVNNWGFPSAASVITIPGLAEGYYYVSVEYDGPKGYDSSASPVFAVTPGSVDSWTAEISPNSSMQCFERVGPLACRIGGQGRFDVSAGISELGFDPGVPVVYIANGLNYPDALSAAPAASLQGGPLLLVTPTEIPAPIAAEIARLRPAKIVVVGGPASVSPAVFTQLSAMAPEILRIGGLGRYEVSRGVAEYAFGGPDGPGATVAYIATGRNFPDALSAGGAAALQFAPVITVDGEAQEVDPETRQLLIDLGVTTVKIAGGPASVSPALMASIDAIPGIEVMRLWGLGRYEASGAINRDAFTTADVVFLAVGTNYPDALSGGAVAGAFGAPIYVIPRECIPSYVLDDIESFGATQVIVLGGPGSVADSVLDYAECP